MTGLRQEESHRCTGPVSLGSLTGSGERPTTLVTIPNGSNQPENLFFLSLKMHRMIHPE